jgi:YndJ-like protein
MPDRGASRAADYGPWILLPRVLAAFGLLSSFGWWSHLGGGILVLALMLAPAVVVPLGLALVASSGERSPLPRAYRVAVCIMPLDVVVATVGWTAPPGDAAAIACATVHVVFCGVVTLFAVARTLERMTVKGWRGLFTPLPELAIDVGLVLLPVGSVWLLASRAAVSLAGFHEPVVTLTAAHFHYAGFAAPVVLGCVGRAFELDALRTARAYRVAAVTVCAGIPLTAIGILTTHAVEAAAAVLLASGMLVVCTLLVAVVPRRAARSSKLAAGLFAVAGVALLGTMGLAVMFALTSSAGRGSTFDGPLDVQTMITFHGGGNALGFALGALVALTIIDRGVRA